MSKNKEELQALLDHIKLPDEAARNRAWQRWDSLGKPLRSLGKLEKQIVKIAGIFGSEDFTLEKKACVVMCGDHGVVAEGVTQTDSSVTRTVAENMTRGMASINIFAGKLSSDVFIIDMGMDCPNYENKQLIPGTISDRKIRRGTGNLAREAAMTDEECIEAILTGIHITGELAEKGYKIIGIGEMGIGNTTPSSALAAMFTGLSPEVVTGRGAGLSDEGLARKTAAIAMGLERCRKQMPAENSRYGQIDHILCIMSQIGGLELAGLTGMILGSAIYHIPVVLDGWITEAAALCAHAMAPEIKTWMLGSHISTEPAAKKITEILELDPILEGGFCLGEGTGAALAMSLLDYALAEYREMKTFEEIKVAAYEHLSDH